MIRFTCLPVSSTYFLIFLLFVNSCTVNKPKGHLVADDIGDISYYANFDLVNFKPLDKVEVPYYFPYLKVLSDSAGIKRVEAFWNKEGPVKVYNRIKLKGFKAYESTSKFLDCTTVDTLISLTDRLYEFRNCYYEKSVNEQTVFIYKKNGKDTIDLDYFRVSNLYKDTTGRLAADNVVHEPVGETKYSFSTEKYAIVRQIAKIRILCKTRNSTGWCMSGYRDQLYYPYLGCFYWSLFYDPHWRVMTK